MHAYNFRPYVTTKPNVALTRAAMHRRVLLALAVNDEHALALSEHSAQLSPLFASVRRQQMALQCAGIHGFGHAGGLGRGRGSAAGLQRAGLHACSRLRVADPEKQQDNEEDSEHAQLQSALQQAASARSPPGHQPWDESVPCLSSPLRGLDASGCGGIQPGLDVVQRRLRDCHRRQPADAPVDGVL